MKRLLFLIILIPVFTITCGNNDPQRKLAVSDRLPVIDGIITNDEYTLLQEFGSMKLSLVRSQNKLCVALQAETTNWLAVGIGSSRMDGSVIFIGYVKDGQIVYSEEKGTGHSHMPVDEKDRISVRHAIKEENGITTLEVECNLSGIISMDTTELRFILATGEDDSFMSPHTIRRGLVVTLE